MAKIPKHKSESNPRLDGQQGETVLGGKIIIGVILYFMILFMFSRLSASDRIIEGRALWPIFVQAAVVTAAALFALNFISKLDAKPGTRLIVSSFMLGVLILMGIGVFYLTALFTAPS